MDELLYGIRQNLFDNADEKYGKFHSKLIPTVPPETIIGVRVPVLRKMAKKLYKDGNYEGFMRILPHYYYEENNLHAFLIEQIKDYETCIKEVDAFLPYVDNWATCDMMNPKCFGKNPKKLIGEVEKWLCSKDVYTVRYGIGMLMRYYLNDNFRMEYLEKVSEIKSDEYYINMMIAWYFATALSARWDEAITYMENERLSVWVHNKTIRKALESYRITDEQKEILKRLKRD